MQSIGIIGGGVLGQAVARGFIEHAEIKISDMLKERRTHDIREVAQCDFVFICLPTPALPDGRCDTSAIEHVLEMCEREGWWTKDRCYVIRSTVPVGFTQAQADQRGFKLPLFHSPEFLTARCALTDFQTPARNIIGMPQRPEKFDPVLNAMRLTRALQLGELYKKRFPGVPTMLMSSDASELVKLACNGFFASKVTLFNVLYDLCQKRTIDWQHVLGGILSDGRIAHAHTNVPGPDGQQGFGGTCVPGSTMVRLSKDVSIRIDQLKTGDGILSLDADCNQLESKLVSDVKRREYQGELLVFETERGVFECTPDHLLPIIRQGTKRLIRAEEITTEDSLLAQ